MPRKKTQAEVVQQFRGVHGDRYDYSRVLYVDNSTKVGVICSVHGSFSIQPGHHLNRVGCKKCFFDSQKLTKAEFIERSEKHFGSRYDYSLFENQPPFGEKVEIRCLAHGVIFLQEPRNHQRGHVGCPQCKSLKHALNKGQLTASSDESNLLENFRRKAFEVHGERYSYKEFVYTNFAKKGEIVCTEHGAFFQAPGNHLSGSGCPQCARDSLSAGTFKQQCKDLGIDYWRALKRREAGMNDKKVFKDDYVRSERETSTALTVYGVNYPNMESACRALLPTANPTTIGRWIRCGMAPEEAFERMPNPGYAAGLIYLVTHAESGKQYVGLTIQTLERRWTYHLQQARAGHIKGDDSLHAAIREHGAEAFTMVQIDSGTTKVNLEKKERQWIKAHDTLTPTGYNISTGGVSGGSNRKPTTFEGKRFPSVGAVVKHISQTRNISLDAAKARLRFGRVDVMTPAKKGESLVKTRAYKAWSRIVHGALNPKTKDYILGVDTHEPWRKFEAFLEDVGQPADLGMAFTRREKSKGFFPENCAWLTKSESSRLNAAHMKFIGTLTGRKARQKVKGAKS